MYVRVCCECLEVLLQSDAGVEYLTQNGIVRDIAELLRNEVEGVHVQPQT